MRFSVKSIIMLTLMLIAASMAWALRPTVLIADLRPKVNLELLIPKQFGDWRELQHSNAQIINPQQAELLTKLYSQTLSRTYINSKNEVMMLSIAYGANQSDAVQLHYPEVCYPAQGFQLHSNVKGTLVTAEGPISVRRLTTSLGQRFEPVTYWTTIGDQVVQGGIHTKFAQMRYGFKGQIPDGLLIRVSSITNDAEAGLALQGSFATQLISAVSPDSRSRLIGDLAVHPASRSP